MNAAKLAVLAEHCRELKLPRVVREYESLVRQASDAEWEYGDFLIHLLELEVLGRRDATANRRIREAHFPEIKTLDQFGWAALKGVPKPKVIELATCEFLTTGDDVVIAGPIGTGKTMLATASGGPLRSTSTRHSCAKGSPSSYNSSGMTCRTACGLRRSSLR